ncbi:hypothetical protein PFISCL1PPCAC_10710, partial [Pristionchus fissidentatus]
DSVVWTEWSEWSTCRCGDSHRSVNREYLFRRRQRHCLGSIPSCGACGTEWTRCPLSASSSCSVEVSDWSEWLPTKSGDAFRFRCWSQLQPNKTVVVGLRGEGRQLFQPDSSLPCVTERPPTTTRPPIKSSSEISTLGTPVAFVSGLLLGIVITVVAHKLIDYWKERRAEQQRLDVSQYSFVAEKKWFI